MEGGTRKSMGWGKKRGIRNVLDADAPFFFFKFKFRSVSPALVPVSQPFKGSEVTVGRRTPVRRRGGFISELASSCLRWEPLVLRLYPCKHAPPIPPQAPIPERKCSGICGSRGISVQYNRCIRSGGPISVNFLSIMTFLHQMYALLALYACRNLNVSFSTTTTIFYDDDDDI